MNVEFPSRNVSTYETMLYTGLRVSEIEQIKRNDCIISENSVKLYFTGKGGISQDIDILKDNNSDYFEQLIRHISESSIDVKIFYSAQYLQEKAHAKGFQCHDLRRAFAKLAYKKHKRIRVVQSMLRHKNLKTTKRYLKSKITI